MSALRIPARITPYKVEGVASEEGGVNEGKAACDCRVMIPVHPKPLKTMSRSAHSRNIDIELAYGAPANVATTSRSLDRIFLSARIGRACPPTSRNFPRLLPPLRGSEMAKGEFGEIGEVHRGLYAAGPAGELSRSANGRNQRMGARAFDRAAGLD